MISPDGQPVQTEPAARATTDAASAREPSSPNASRSAGKPRFQGLLIGPLELMMHDGFSLKRIAVAIGWFLLLLPLAVAVLEWGGI